MICPLDWGLGHATRMVPVIRENLEAGNRVIIGADHGPLAFLRREFPQLEWIRMPGETISYSSGRVQAIRLLLQVPRFLRSIRREHRLLEQILSEYNINEVISDNRYGLWTRNARCILVTHQIMVKMPSGLGFAEKMTYRMIRRFIRRFDECRIPDTVGIDNYSGDLSHKHPLHANTKFIGILSRFSLEYPDVDAEKYDILVILSGPEPQRTILEEKLTGQLHKSSQISLIIRGKPEESDNFNTSGNITYADHVSSSVMKKLILNAGLVICRSGYSSVMDLVTLNKPAVLIPTPGQTEQEYLAEYLGQRKQFIVFKQDTIDLEKAIQLAGVQATEASG
ncbi:MAG: glycosyltransferase [Bacteroidetes bacterium]|nr:glycosyltransferase [Bacteroidota bacterium]